jgi:hypothetical protein
MLFMGQVGPSIMGIEINKILSLSMLFMGQVGPSIMGIEINKILRLSMLFMGQCAKNCRIGGDTNDNNARAHSMLDTYGYKGILRICNYSLYSGESEKRRNGNAFDVLKSWANYNGN